MRSFTLLLFWLTCSFSLIAQNRYTTYSGLIDQISIVGRRQTVQLTSLGLTPASRNIWCLRIGGENREVVPAIGIIAGLDANGLFGTELALRMADQLSQDEQLLSKASFYIIPLANPDVYANDPTKIRFEKHVNAQPYDDDRDGTPDEDPFEDLNADNMITMMRVSDITGSWTSHATDPRVMVKADLSQGERGQYRLFTEGFDNDRDGHINEDGVGGINLNRNFTYQYPAFEEGAGPYPVSAIESRAILDLLMDQWNVHTLLCFGEANTLSKHWESAQPDKQSRKIYAPLPADGPVFKWVSENYQQYVPTEDAPIAHSMGGDLVSWAYYHYGRYSFSTPGWWIPHFELDSGDMRDISNEDIRFLVWAEKNGHQDYWVDWQTVDHPDFPDQKVEVGGIAPYARLLPPYEMVDSIASNHLEFVRDLAVMLPRIEIQNLKVEKLSDGLNRISIDIYNAGVFPTHSALGQKTRWVRKPKVELILNSDEDQSLISGKPVEILQPLSGDHSQKRSWIVRGEGSLVLKIGSPICGFDQEVINLK